MPSAANAVVATAALIRTYWPDKPVSEQKLSFNMAVMNLVTPFFGGMPMCHGAEGWQGSIVSVPVPVVQISKKGLSRSS